MKKRFPKSIFIRGMLIVIAIDFAVILIVTMIGWWSGWTSLEEFRRAILLAGIMVMGIGLIGIKGNLDLSRSFEYQYSMSVTKDESWKRTQQDLNDLARSYAFTLIMFGAGSVCLLIGWLL
jgi:hypothetical protein